MNIWFEESHGSNLKLSHKVKEIIHTEKTPFQELSVVELEEYGRALILEDVVQTTLKDEFVYHEMISHVPLFTHKDPKKVLIIGGGDGGAVRECLKHESVEEITLVEIDERVVENCKKYLPQIAGKLQDPKVRVEYADGIVYIANCTDKFDVILVDSPDPMGPATNLYARDFYKKIYKALKEDGMLVAQTESLWIDSDLACRVTKWMCDIFPIVRTYQAAIPTYQGGFWSFTLASKKYDPNDIEEESICEIETKYYHGKLHKAAFVLPKFVHDMISNK